MRKFKVGDIVKLKRGDEYECGTTNGLIDDGQIEREQVRFKITSIPSDDNRIEYNILSPKNKVLDWCDCVTFSQIELVAADKKEGITESKKRIRMDTPMKKEEDKISFKLYRKGGSTFFAFQIAPKIEKVYSDQPHEIKESTSWTGLKFYSIPKTLQDAAYKRMLQDFRLFDDYGQGLYRDGMLNIAWIRTVGGSGEIKITEPLSFAELSSLVRNATQFLKEYYQEHFREFVLHGKVSI